MNDDLTTVRELRNFVEKFVDEREWVQFHCPKNMSMAIAIEAAELMEKFRWCDNSNSYKDAQNNKDEVEQELADILITAICFARVTGIDISSAVKRKLKLTEKKYPVHKAKGVCTKYDKL